YSGLYSDNLHNWSRLESYLKTSGPGLYILGLSASWGHVLFLRYLRDGQIILCHSGPTPQGARVSYDDARSYITVFMRPHIIHATKINQMFARKWLAREPIYPIRCKIYSPEGRRLIRFVQKFLKNNSCQINTIDGIYGKKTRAALSQFQRKHHLPVTQLPDRRTVTLMRILQNSRE
ncbi:TPA: peptidoglycan-binding protein, partial [Candidatus Poribacteria bacterium]|nr:peptidoglycan-binding protein [Candidatus Poribacteria bacterium]